MKKLLGSTLALALIVPASANAELLKNFKLGGSLEVSAVSATNVKDFSTTKYDKIGTAQTRVMLNADWDLLDDVHAKVSLTKNDRTYGNAANATPANGSQNLQDMANNVAADEAFVKIDKLFGALDSTLGRQFYGEPGDMVIYFGPKSGLYGMPVTALDGGRFDWNGETVGATLLVAKVTGGALGAADTANVNLRGLEVHAKPMDDVSGSAYVYNKETVRSGTSGTGVVANDKLYVAGLKAKATMGGAWLKAEIAKNFGENRTGVAADGSYAFTGNYTGWAAKANGGMKVDLDSIGALTGWGEAGIGSGADNNAGNTNRAFQAIAGDYRPGGIYGRFGTGASATIGSSIGGIASNTLSNRVIFGAGVKVTPAALSKLTAGLSVWNYRVQRSASLATAADGNKFLGNEYDLDLSWAHSENVMLSAGVGSFQPGRNIIVQTAAANVSVSPARLCYTDVSVKF